MRRSERKPRPKIRDEELLPPVSSDESGSYDSDKDPEFNPEEARKGRLELFLSKRRTIIGT